MSSLWGEGLGLCPDAGRKDPTASGADDDPENKLTVFHSIIRAVP